MSNPRCGCGGALIDATWDRNAVRKTAPTAPAWYGELRCLRCETHWESQRDDHDTKEEAEASLWEHFWRSQGWRRAEEVPPAEGWYEAMLEDQREKEPLWDRVWYARTWAIIPGVERVLAWRTVERPPWGRKESEDSRGE